jgi:hypothetical protein
MDLIQRKLEVGGAVEAVATNLEGVAVFVLSRMWSDMISAFIFGLHAIPYCGGFIKAACKEEASSWAQLEYTLIILPIAGLLKHLAEWSGLTKLPGMYDDIPMILKYIVGWAFGNTVVQYMNELKLEDGCGDDCTGFEVWFTVMWTAIVGGMMIFIFPLTKVIEFGNGPVVNFVEDLLEDILDMVVRCFDVSIMCVWATTFTNWYSKGLSGEVEGVGDRAVFLWACTITFIGTLLLVFLEELEGSMKRSKEKVAKEMEKAGLTMVTHWSDHAIEFSNVLQLGLSWVAGCAWSDLLFRYVDTLNGLPTLENVLWNALVVLVITCASTLWVIITCPLSDDPVASLADRSEAEKQFVSYALCFFIYGGWLVFIRMLFANFSLQVERFVLYADSSFGYHFPPIVGDIVAVIIFAPIFTVVSFKVAEKVMSALASKAGKEEVPHGSKAEAEKKKTDALKTVREIPEKEKEAEKKVKKAALRKLMKETSFIACACTGKFDLAKEFMDYKLENGGLKVVADFLESAAEFVLSRMWSDLITVFVFGLHAIPYCESFVMASCASEAPSSKQFVFAAILVPIAGLVQHIVESTGLTKLPGMWDNIPMILKYIVGWAFGNAMQQYLIEWKAAGDYAMCDMNGNGERDCTNVNVYFSTAVTLVIGVVVFFLKPLSEQIECGNGDCVNSVEDFVEDTFKMIVRGLEVSGMVLWYYTSYNFIHTSGLNSEVANRSNILWSLTITFFGALS